VAGFRRTFVSQLYDFRLTIRFEVGVLLLNFGGILFNLINIVKFEKIGIVYQTYLLLLHDMT